MNWHLQFAITRGQTRSNEAHRNVIARWSTELASFNFECGHDDSTKDEPMRPWRSAYRLSINYRTNLRRPADEEMPSRWHDPAPPKGAVSFLSLFISFPFLSKLTLSFGTRSVPSVYSGSICNVPDILNVYKRNVIVTFVHRIHCRSWD